MILKIHIPAPPLNQFVENMVYHCGYNPLHSRERLLPDGSVDIVIDLTEIPKNVYENEDFNRNTAFRRGWISGFRREFISIDAGQNSEMLVIRFKSGGAYPFLQFPLQEITDQVVELDNIWGRKFFDLREQLHNIRSIPQRFARVEQFLHQRLGDICAPDPCIAYAVNAIRNTQTALSIKHLREQVGYSHKHFIHLFEKHTGTTPKYFSRIMKFQRILQRLETQQSIQWSQIALQCGYYDQAHFINEFRHFSGINPSAYLGEKGEYINYIPLD